MAYLLETNLPAFLGLLALLIFVLIKPVLNKDSNQKLIFIFAFILIMILLQTLDFYFAESNWSYSYLCRRITSALGYGLYPPVFILLIHLYTKKKLSWMYYIPFVVNFILCLISMPTYIVFKINPQNSFGHGPLYFITVLVPLFYLILMGVKIFKDVDYFNKMESNFLVGLLVAVVLSMVLDIVVGTKFLTWTVSAYLVMILYAILLIEDFKLDALTNVFSRRSYENFISLHSMLETGTIVFLDIDHFKEINDTKGHAYGDEVLKFVAENLKTCFAKLGFIYRIGGDEFFIVLPHTTKSIEKEIEQFIRLNQKKEVTMAYGICHITTPLEFEKAFKIADESMYKWKNKSKG